MVRFEIDDKKNKTVTAIVLTPKGEKTYKGITKSDYQKLIDENGKLYSDDILYEILENKFKINAPSGTAPINLILTTKRKRTEKKTRDTKQVIKDFKDAILKESAGDPEFEMNDVFNSLDIVIKSLYDDELTMEEPDKVKVDKGTKDLLIKMFSSFLLAWSEFELEDVKDEEMVKKDFDEYRNVNISNPYNETNFKSETKKVASSPYAINHALQQTLIHFTAQILYLTGNMSSLESGNFGSNEMYFITNFYKQRLFNFSVYTKNGEIVIINRKLSGGLTSKPEISFTQFLIILLKQCKRKYLSDKDFASAIIAKLMVSALKTKHQIDSFYDPIPLSMDDAVGNKELTDNIYPEAIQWNIKPITALEYGDYVLMPIELSYGHERGKYMLGSPESEKLDTIITLLEKLIETKFPNMEMPTSSVPSSAVNMPTTFGREVLQEQIMNLKPTKIIKRESDPYKDAPLKRDIEKFDRSRLKHVRVSGLDFTTEENDDLLNGKIQNPMPFILRNINPLYRMYEISQKFKDKVNEKYRVRDPQTILAGLGACGMKNYVQPKQGATTESFAPILKIAPLLETVIRKGLTKIASNKLVKGLPDKDLFSEGDEIWNINDYYINVETKQGRFWNGTLDQLASDKSIESAIEDPLNFIMTNKNLLYRIFKLPSLMEDKLKSKYLLHPKITQSIVSGLESMLDENEKQLPSVGWVQALIPIAKTAIRLAPIVYPFLKKGFNWIKDKIKNRNAGFGLETDAFGDTLSSEDIGTLDVANITESTRTSDIKDFSKYVSI